MFKNHSPRPEEDPAVQAVRDLIERALPVLARFSITPTGVIAGEYDVLCDQPEIGGWKPYLPEAERVAVRHLYDARRRGALQRCVDESRPLAECIRDTADQEERVAKILQDKASAAATRARKADERVKKARADLNDFKGAGAGAGLHQVLSLGGLLARKAAAVPELESALNDREREAMHRDIQATHSSARQEVARTLRDLLPGLDHLAKDVKDRLGVTQFDEGIDESVRAVDPWNRVFVESPAAIAGRMASRAEVRDETVFEALEASVDETLGNEARTSAVRLARNLKLSGVISRLQGADRLYDSGLGMTEAVDLREASHLLQVGELEPKTGIPVGPWPAVAEQIGVVAVPTATCLGFLSISEPQPVPGPNPSLIDSAPANPYISFKLGAAWAERYRNRQGVLEAEEIVRKADALGRMDDALTA